MQVGRKVNQKCLECAKIPNIDWRKRNYTKPECYIGKRCGHKRNYYKDHDFSKKMANYAHRYLKYKGDSCVMCGAKEAAKELEVHHIKPQSLGGEDARFNTVTMCGDCHRFITRYYKIAGIQLARQGENEDGEYIREYLESLPPL